MFLCVLWILASGQISIPLERRGLSPFEILEIRKSRELSDSEVKNYGGVRFI